MTRRSSAARQALLASILLFWPAFLAASAQPDAVASDPQARNETTVRAAFDRWAAGTGSAFDMLSEDVIWTIRGSGPFARTYNGKDSFLREAAEPLISRLATPIVPELHYIWTANDRVVVRFDGTATTTSGGPYHNQYVWIFRMENGRVVEAEAFLDLVAYQAVVDNNQPRVQ